MSLFRHILVLFFIFATHQSVKSEGGTHRSTRSTKIDPDPELDVVTFNFSGTTGSLKLEMSMLQGTVDLSIRCEYPQSYITQYEQSDPIWKSDKCVKFIKKTKALRDPEEATAVLGTEENPAESCNDVDTGSHYIKNNMSDQAFKVKCNVDKKTTCLIVKSKIEASSITSSAITLSDQIWLSQTDFDVHSLYNKIGGSTGTNRAQISHLLSTSTSVNQTIRYYYNTAFSNGTLIKTKDNIVESLKALLWNDHLVGSEITKQLPMKFTFSKTEYCWSGSHWKCSTINFQDTSNQRLPVTDFYIEDVRAKLDVPTIYFELVDLCFGYD